MTPDDLGQLSETSQAMGKPKYVGQGDRFMIRFSGQEKVEMQVPVKRCGSRDLALRVAELCYEQLELGRTKAEAMEFRDSLLGQCKELSPGKSPGKSPAKSPAEPAKEDIQIADAQAEDLASRAIRMAAEAARAAALAVSKLTAPAVAPVEVEEVEDGQQDSLKKKKRVLFNDGRIEGRASGLPNASINGVYVAKDKTQLFHGRRCWEKLGASPAEHRRLFYSAPLAKWKICERFDDTAPVIAYAPVDTLGHLPPAGPDVQWYVFDGSSHVLDPAVHFLEQQPSSKRQKPSEPKAKDFEMSQLELAELHYKQCLEMYQVGKKMSPQDASSAAVILGRVVSKKNYLINGVYLQRAGKFHGALCYQKISANDKGHKFLLFSATKSSWRITDKIQDQQSFAYARVEDRGVDSPADLPRGYLIWKVYQSREVGYVKDDEVYCCRLDLDALLARAERAKAALEACKMSEEPEPLSDAPSVRVAAALAETKTDAAGRRFRAAQKTAEGAAEDFVVRTPPESNSGHAGHGSLSAQPKGLLVSSDEEEGVVVVEPRRQEPRTEKPTVRVIVKSLADLEGPKPKVLWPKRACAKMLVRAGSRCSCCFRPIDWCEKR
ncbi:unnamed protein product [Effrenium voratum]|nr:unnamed protein product [Effrenium voratum]